MPRIEIIPGGWNESREKARGDGTPTIDVCRGCGHNYDQGGPVPAHVTSAMKSDGVNVGTNPTVGETEVDHPPYDEVELKCIDCDVTLFQMDD
jgi:hypothetical protein